VKSTSSNQTGENPGSQPPISRASSAEKSWRHPIAPSTSTGPSRAGASASAGRSTLPCIVRLPTGSVIVVPPSWNPSGQMQFTP
jgi:hypothetical protein